MTFYGSKMAVVRCAIDLQVNSGGDSRSITITRVGLSEVFSVSFVTDGLSDDTVKKLGQTYSLRATHTSQPNTQVGPYPQRVK